MKFKKNIVKFNGLFSFLTIISSIFVILSSTSLYIGTNYTAMNYDYANNKKIKKYGFGPSNWGYQWDDNGVFLEQNTKNNREQYNNSYDKFLNEHLKIYYSFKEEYKKNPTPQNKIILDISKSVYISRILVIVSSSVLSLFSVLFLINVALLTIAKGCKIK